METIYRDYSPKGVKFYYVYKALAHPEKSGYVSPFALEERLLHIKEAKRTLGTEFTWICDTMENDLIHALGNAPNSEFILDRQGRVVVRRAWSNPKKLRADLEEIVGPVEKQTTIRELNLKKEPSPKPAPSGIVKRVKLPESMQPLKIKPDTSSTEPFYVKLRAEVNRQVLTKGKGKLLLGFHLDPIYNVHWNNLVEPLSFEIKSAIGIKISPTKGKAPLVKVPSDIDPREFLVNIEKVQNDLPLEVTVKYFACNDEQGWCKPVTQSYTVFLEVDIDGGWRLGRPQDAPTAIEH